MRLVATRLVVACIAICALSQNAMAQTPECKSITDSGQRLACYDKAAPPVASSASAKPAQRTGPAPKVDAAKYVDAISAEDAALNARIKNICRGC